MERLDLLERYASLVQNKSFLKHIQTDGAPFLTDLTEEFEKSKFRLMYIGQETNGWDDPPEELSPKNKVDWLLAAYRDFDFAACGRYANSPFWQFQRSLLAELGEENYRCSVWSNLYRTHVEGRIENQSAVVRRDILEWQRDILSAELSFYKPKMVLFMTGPSCDDAISAQLAGAEFEPLVNTSGLTVGQLCRIRHPLLPRSTFRTYHPKYLRLSQHWDVRDVLVRAVMLDNAGSSTSMPASSSLLRAGADDIEKTVTAFIANRQQDHQLPWKKNDDSAERSDSLFGEAMDLIKQIERTEPNSIDGILAKARLVAYLRKGDFETNLPGSWENLLAMVVVRDLIRLNGKADWEDPGAIDRLIRSMTEGASGEQKPLPRDQS